MFARCERVEPACMRASSSANVMASFFSSCLTVTPLRSGSVSAPLAPLMGMSSGAMVAVTPWGRSTGAFATRDIAISSGHDAQDFAALADGARLAIRHHTLGCRDDHRAHATEHPGQLFLATIDAQPRLADALEA